jgi:uncharacterized membrane-anchored protein YhcB (DUF1043 family)
MAEFDLVANAPLIVAIIVGIITPAVIFFSRVNMTNVTGMVKMETVQNDLTYIKRDLKESFVEVKDLIKEKDSQWSESREMLAEKLEEIGRTQGLQDYKISQMQIDINNLKAYKNGGGKAPV